METYMEYESEVELEIIEEQKVEMQPIVRFVDTSAQTEKLVTKD
ncbi:MAG: hypothetical protein ACK521_05505 [bacterium]